MERLAEQERLFLEQGELEKLIQLYQAEAEAVLQNSEGLPQMESPDPSWAAEALWRAGMLLHWRLGQFDRAIGILRRALAIKPDFQPALAELEDLLLKTNRYTELAALYEEELNTATDDDSIFILEALLALNAGALAAPQKELVALRKLMALRPEDERLHRRLVHVLERLGQYEALEEALRNLEHLVLAEEQQNHLKLIRAHLYEGPLQRAEAAIATYREILDVAPENAFAFASLEGLLRREGKYDELTGLLRQAADQASSDSSGQAQRIRLLRGLGSIYSRHLNQPQKALEIYSELLSLEPDDRIAQRNMARAAEAASDASKLAEALEAQAASAPDATAHAFQLIRLAEILEDRLSDSERAEEMLTKAVAVSPDKGAVVDALEAIVRRQIARGDHEEAAKGLAKLQDEAPSEVIPIVLEEKAWLTSGPLKEHEKGAEFWSQALRYDSSNRRARLALTRLAARRRDPAAIAEAASRLADHTSDAKLQTALYLRAGVFHNLAGDGSRATTESYRQAIYRSSTQGGRVPMTPETIEAHLGLIAEQELGAEERADLNTRMAEIAPDRVREDMRLSLALIYEEAGRFKEAVRELAHLLERDPDNLPAFIVLQRIAEASDEKELEAKVWIQLANLFSDRTAKAEAYSRAARLMQDLARLDEAAVLLRHVLALKPDDAAAYDRLYRIYKEAHNIIGLDELLGHRIRHTEEGGLLIGLHFERAELRLQKLGDKRGAARDLLQILRLDPKHLEALRQLSLLYDEAGIVSRALELYRKYIDATEPLSLKRPAVLRVADLLHEKQGRTDEAIEICRKFLELSPEDDLVMEQLAELYVKLKDIPHAISILERLCGLRDDRQWKARTQQRIGALYWQDLKDLQEARVTLVRARDSDPTNLEIIKDLRQLCRQMNLGDEMQNVLSRAKDDLRDIITNEPLSVELYQKLMQVAEWDEDEYTLLATMGVLCYLNAADNQDRDLYLRRIAKMTFEPKHQVGAQAWRDALVESGAKNAFGEIWAVIAESVPHLFEGRVPTEPSTFGVSKNDKIDRKTGGSIALRLDRIGNAFGLVDFDMYLSPNQPDLVAGIAAERPALIVGHSVLSSMSTTARFNIGRTLSLLRDHAFALEILHHSELELLFYSAIYTADSSLSFPLPRSQVEAESRRLKKVLSRKSKQNLPLVVNRWKQEGGDLQEWVRGVLGTANRAGLLVCGDILAALDQLVEPLRGSSVREKKSSEEIAKIVGKNRQAVELVLYSISKNYLSLRRELHL